MDILFDCLTAWLAPFICFTAEEAWDFLPGQKADSVHLADWPDETFDMAADEKAVWQNLFAHREPALAELEKARQEKLIGKALEARVTITAKSADLEIALAHAEPLRELINISQLELVEEENAEAPSYVVTKAEGAKCKRCWRWETSVVDHNDHPEICERGVEAVM